MPEANEHAREHSMLFTSLVMTLSTSAMQQLGKLVNPVSHKTEVDLEGAQMTIDLLAMLREKTRGNLAADEERLLASVLSSLQMNYVETAASAPAQAPKQEEKAGAQAAAPGGDKAAPEPAKPPEGESAGGPDAAGPGDKKDPRFHKSYGEK